MKLILYCTFLLFIFKNLKAQTDSIPIISEKTCQTEIFCLDTVNCGVLPIILTCDAKSRSKNLPILKYSYSIDWDSDGKIDLTGASQNVKLDESKGLKPGKHKIKWVVKDFNNLENSCEKSFELVNCALPDIIESQIVQKEFLPYSCITTLVHNDFKYKFYNQCVDTHNLTIKIAAYGQYDDNLKINEILALDNQIIRDYNLSSFGVEMFRIYFINKQNKFKYFDQSVYYYSNSYSCCLTDYKSYVRFGGIITNEEDEPLNNVKVKINGRREQKTDKSGTYNFNYSTKKYKVDFDNNDNFRNGITTADVVQINKIILGINVSTSPYKRIAADINNDRKISTSDMIELRKLILFIQDTFVNNTSWKYIAKKYNFVSDKPESENYPTNLTIDTFGFQTNNIIGLKIGDVNGSAKINMFSDATERSLISKSIELQDIEIQENRDYAIELPITDLLEQDGFQFALKINQNLADYIRIVGLDADSYHFDQSSGELYVSYVKGLSIGNELIINFVAKKSCWLHDLVQFSLDKMKSEYYIDNQSYTFGFEYSNQKFFVSSPQPNPFQYNTQMKIFTPEPEILKIEIIRSDGVLVNQRNLFCQKGENILQLSETDLKESGVYQCVIKSKQGISVQKIIFIK